MDRQSYLQSLDPTLLLGVLHYNEDLPCIHSIYRWDHKVDRMDLSGVVMTLADFLQKTPDADEAAIRHALEGNLCRCTGYQQIIDSIKGAAAIHRGEVEAAAPASDPHPDPHPEGPEEPNMPPGHAR